MPQVCDPPAAIVAKVSPPFTATGDGCGLKLPLEPFPSSPSPCHPQQYAAPPVTMPHVNGPRADNAVKVYPPATAVGAAIESLVVPTPSSREVLLPQQYAWPVAVRPHACALPTVSDANRSAPLTGTGIESNVMPVRPSAPSLLSPQQNA